MSTYQYYEFLAIDRPLTPDEQQAVARFSSRKFYGKEGTNEWIEGEGWLDRLAPLRDDLSNGDYRRRLHDAGLCPA
jgi:hypothetical protein